MSDIREEASSSSVKSFVAALVFNGIVFGAEICVFTLIRPHFKAIYEPRTYAPHPSKQSKPLSRNRFLWPLAVWRSDPEAIRRVNGMDAYCFVRFLRMMVKVFLPIWIISWAVLFPLTTIGTSAETGPIDNLDKLTYGNVGRAQRDRLVAHLVLAWVFTFWILYNIRVEMQHFVTARQQHLIEPSHAKSLQANTILVAGIPQRYLNKRALLKVFEELPGGVKRIWINRNLKELPDIYDRRLAACNKLESAEIALLRTAAKLRLEEQKKGANGAATKDVESKKETDPEAAPANPTEVETALSIVPRDQRPTHRLGPIPFTGEKVDTIEWAREEIKECNRLLEEGRSTIEEEENNVVDGFENSGDANGSDASGKLSFKPVAVVKQTTAAIKGEVTARIAGYGDMKYPPLSSAFITFNQQIAAHLAVQVLAHHDPYRMATKYNEISPQDVIWANLNLNPYEQRIRAILSYAATAALIIFWSIPVAFVGAISNIQSVCRQVVWLEWICGLPDPVVGIISGILPPVLLAILMALLPIILRLMARFEGIPRFTGLELSLMTRYFCFLVVHSFLIVTISSGILPALQQIFDNPASIANTLASQLPKASTFFLTYVILQGLSGTAGGFLQIAPLAIYYIKLVLLGSSPRSVYSIKYVLGSVAWGTLFPSITLLSVISIAYSIISPVINGLTLATFFLFYQLYKYLFLWVYDQKPSSDTGGLFFPKAIQHVFVGLYIEEVCLAGLFLLARAIPQGILMIVLIVFTAGFHIMINQSYGPLLHALPLTLKDKTYSPNQGIPGDDSGGSANEFANQDRDAEAEGDIDYVESPSKSFGGKDKANADAATRQKIQEDELGFAHPAITMSQQTIWIPKDTLGLSDEAVNGCEEMGVTATQQGAFMDEKGKVDVPRADAVPEDVVRSFA